MSIKPGLKGLLAATSFALAAVFGSSTASAFPFSVGCDIGDTGPCIPTSGFPNFINTVKVSLSAKGTLKLRGSKDFLLDIDGTPANEIPGDASKYNADVDFDKDTGAFIAGTLSLTGRMESIGVPKKTQILTADIISWNFQDDADLWGFGTNNIVCNPLVLVGCTTAESIYVTLDESYSTLLPNVASFKTTGTAYTTVPIPASAWLFGSALGLLGWVRRRQQV